MTNRSVVRRIQLFDLEQVRHQHEGQEWVPHWHAEWSFGAIVQGECHCTVAGRPFHPRAGDLIAIAPQTVHTGALTTSSESKSVLVMMLYVPSMWLQREGLAPPARSGLIRSPTLARQARNLTSPDDVQAWLRKAVPRLSNALKPTSATPIDPIPTDAVRALMERVQSAVVSGDWNVSGIARHCGVSRERIHQVMKRWIGMSPSDIYAPFACSVPRTCCCRDSRQQRWRPLAVSPIKHTSRAGSDAPSATRLEI